MKLCPHHRDYHKNRCKLYVVTNLLIELDEWGIIIILNFNLIIYSIECLKIMSLLLKKI